LASVELDLFNRMENTALGVHAACMGGAWQALVFGLLGVQLTDSGPTRGRPVLIPKSWGKVEKRLLFRGQEFLISGEAA
ncbi:MAG: hypothetical protein RJB38_708, partial [Pseudomonadota bacterium]